ncbi:winged helix-turn-helix transcriptional regulator [Sulfuracidifex metallicus]|jgi:Mn-dependent DtxR family transcriptional regulator|uniref:Winged helix-turn-helix transcriptional regulator n=1 Tax=Sulfuracidifex metallicus DSM 6482 = JCM 9184 TaxID=523847 RepID=A0A6A9QMD3_SULME|nr:winged helix-turn-helix transcriptional regulator [Sulfuracidifex metallicus]MCY0850710.1 FeoC-like transcriptional regulator [Sulfuracidifex metallicus]MUN28868.1 winged helix-turn-helix transcriptional regulator [Sulfuracidifex metallicus DSM 6482 = JCM 9184]WOE50621.1 FeoC-like transcriptional regulator [Sulfuracidifex metallicus DSM 6482 = JCM 9184]
MELPPRLQDIVAIIRERGIINMTDLALQLKVSPKTMKGYVRELIRTGIVEVDDEGNVKISQKSNESFEEKVMKMLEIHESQISMLTKEILELKEQVNKLKKRRGEKVET